MGYQPKQIYEFGPYRLDAAERLLIRDGTVIQLQPKVFDLLLALVERHGRLLEKDELMKLVWPDAIVEEANLANNISILRKTLSENGQHFIETVPKRGYRFVAPVNGLMDRSVDPVAVERPLTQVAVATGQEIYPDDRPDATNSVRPRRWRAALTSRWLVALSALIVTGGGFWVARMARQSGASAGKMPRSIAVLPFKPLASNSRDEVMEVGMADTLITKLSSLNQLIVRPTTAIRKYTALDLDPLAAGREQEVEAVLEASYHWTGEKIRVTARLVDVRNGSVLRIYEGEGYCADLFTAQDIVSEKVAGTLLKDLTGEERKLLAKRYTENTRAYFLYVRGLQYYDQRTRDSIEKARQYFRQAIDLDPNYSLAYTGLTQVYSACANLYIYPPKEVMPKAKAAAEQALRLDDSLAEAHTALAITIYYGDWNFKAVEKEYKRALELDQNSAITYRVYAHFLKNMGRFDEALEANQRSLMLDPRSITSQRDRGMFLYQARRYDEAIEQCQRTIELDPTFLRNYHWLARAYADKGLYDQAVAAYLREEEVLDPKRATSLRVAYAVSGWRGYWQKQLNLYKEEAKRQLVSPIEFARIHARLEEKEQAIVWLEKAYDERDPALLMLNVDPEFRNLRSEPRFTKLLRDIGFSP